MSAKNSMRRRPAGVLNMVLAVVSLVMVSACDNQSNNGSSDDDTEQVPDETICGDDKVETGEECDDGNTAVELCEIGEGGCMICDASCKEVAGDCPEDTFGSTCAACTCVNGSQCADGPDGDGACTCLLGWSGSSCQNACAFEWSAAPQAPTTSFAYSAGLTDHLWNDPTVLIEDGTYRMWLTAGNPSAVPLHVRVHHATSADGVSWNLDTTPILGPGAAGEWDDKATETPSVVRDGSGTYHLYYSGIKIGAAPGVLAMGHATSPDGLNWTKDANNPILDVVQSPEVSDWGVYSIGEPGALYHPGEDKIYLYHIGFGASGEHEGDIAILLATSTDGSDFTYHRDAQGNREPVWSLSVNQSTLNRPRGLSTPSAALGADGQIHLVHDLVQDPVGFDQVGLAWARSSDGIHFSEVDPDIARWKTTSWSTGGLLAPFLVFEEGHLSLWFAAYGVAAPPNWFSDFDSGIARLVGTEVCGRPTVELQLSAGPHLLPGEGATVTAQSSDPENDSLSLLWSVISASAPGVDCSTELGVSESADGLSFTVPIAYTDVRCADEIIITAKVSDGSQTDSDSVTIVVDAPPMLGVEWTEDAGNPVIDLSICPTWDCLEHTDPSLGRAPNGDMLIWYSAGGDAVGPVIGRALSVSDGPFAVSPNAPVIEPDPAGVAPDPLPWDYKRETVSLKWNALSTRWDMLYLGYKTDYFTDPAIGLTQSTTADGLAFPRTAAPIYTPSRPNGWDTDFLTSPSAVLGSDGIWRIYFVGASFALGGSMKVGVLTSSDDGVTWNAGPPNGANPIFEGVVGQWDESILDCYVSFVGGRYMMWYTSFEEPFSFDSPFKIGLATSEDGFTWERYEGNPIITPGAATSWNDNAVLDGEVFIEADGSLTMAAYGSSSVPPNDAFPDFKPNRIGIWRSSAH